MDNDSFSESGKRNVNDTFSSPEAALLLVSTSGKIQFSERAQIDCEQSLSFPSDFKAIERTSRERTSGEW